MTKNIEKRKNLKYAKRIVVKVGSKVLVDKSGKPNVQRMKKIVKDISSINKSIVYCSISAFGQDGPFKNRSAYDHVVQAMSGIMTTTGTKESGPTKVGAAYVDYSTGLNAAFAILAALHQVKQTKKSVRIDVSMLDTSLLLMANMVTEHLNNGWIPTQMGNEAQSGSPSSGMFKTKTSPILLAANNDNQFSSLSDALNIIDKFDKKKWSSETYRKKNQKKLLQEFQRRFIKKTAEELEILLNKFNVPAGRVRTLPETVSEEQFIKRELWSNVEISSIGKNFKLPSIGFKVNENAISPNNPPPVLGINTNDILEELGYSNDQIEELRKENVIN